MTADIRTAAQREVRKPASEGNPIAQFGVTTDIAFVRGAVWAAARVTPTREQLAMTVAQFFGVNDTPEDVADAILKLMQGLAKGESGNP